VGRVCDGAKDTLVGRGHHCGTIVGTHIAEPLLRVAFGIDTVARLVDR